MASKEQERDLSDIVSLTPGFHGTAHVADLIANRIIAAGWEPPKPISEVEIDMMDRIISGLPLGRLYDVASMHPVEVDLDVVSSRIKETTGEDIVFVRPDWVVVPNYENYEICKDGDVRSKWTKRILDLEYRNCASFVEMHDKSGFPHLVSTMELAQIAENLFT